ncbi:DUF907 domain-containing protein [Hortaea werneckii]|uniref:ML-like domain-containing protein n=1 Tax=Hortaea werneckii TaxID=91943 RepID=A0A3M7J5Q9_HORWE|nr:DUF907 domain-containing protein [Hortaea werneckii]KAI6821053.1 DUF907 domain-containing protein [Hortaea werneckii]KAI6927319.1 DUF907 domain-containing protein [Hortaea werneckii]KAI6931388.1 DUF907 domain-containing protein [Hortaea werneckii]KAI6986910.1 DUF907 domain-containing protein [Hortaea werneckii]
MRLSSTSTWLLSAAILSMLPVSVLGADVLSTTGYSLCMNNGSVSVDKLDVTYNKNTRIINFDVAGTSEVEQNVTAKLVVTAYGKTVYTKTFDPCEHDMERMCPVPAASFASSGSETIPEEYASQIPSIAFSIPDLDGNVKMELTGSGGKTVGCVESTVGNGHSLNMPSVSYIAGGVAGAALAMSAASALAAGGHPGASTSSPSFTEVFGWFQSMALNGMLSVQYPQVYQSFSSNFAFSTGLIPWSSMQRSIDSFRSSTGGNLTHANWEYLQNATLVYSDGSNSSSSSGLMRRGIETALLWARDGTTVSVNGSSTDVHGGSDNATSSGNQTSEKHFVSGMQAYVEQLAIPASNTFMTLLLIWAIVVGAIVVLILLLKLILEAWSMFGTIPKSMESWRKRYWWRLAKALTNLILLLYGIWTMYCIYQFTNGDSWAAKILAGVTLGLFTCVLAFFSWRIYTKAHQYKRMEGDAGKLYEDKETWVKYNLFYENYKKGYWWLFVPVIVYMLARACVIAGANGHGMAQTVGQLVVEALMLALLLWTRPFERKSSRWINITIQTVRVISVICVLVFVEELGMNQTTKTVTGLVLIVVQCTLTGILAILIAVNALIACIKENPHRRARKEKEKEKLGHDLDDLTPLDARNSLLMEPMAQKGGDTAYRGPIVSAAPFGDHKGRYDPVPPRPESPAESGRSLSRPSRFAREDDHDHLVSSAASMGYHTDRSVSRSPDRQPRLPDLDFGRAH